MAEAIEPKAPLVVSAVKEQHRILAEAAPVTPEIFERIHELRQRIHESADYQEGMRAFHEKRKPAFTGR